MLARAYRSQPSDMHTRPHACVGSIAGRGCDMGEKGVCRIDDEHAKKLDHQPAQHARLPSGVDTAGGIGHRAGRRVIWLPASFVAKTGEATNASSPHELRQPPSRLWMQAGDGIKTAWGAD